MRCYVHIYIYVPMFCWTEIPAGILGSSSLDGQTCCDRIRFRCLFRIVVPTRPWSHSRYSFGTCGALPQLPCVRELWQLLLAGVWSWHCCGALHWTGSGFGLVTATEVAQVDLELFLSWAAIKVPSQGPCMSRESESERQLRNQVSELRDELRKLQIRVDRQEDQLSELSREVEESRSVNSSAIDEPSSVASIPSWLTRLQ